jgi:MoxR-like ATPase
MNYPYYSGNSISRPATPVELPRSNYLNQISPAHYLPDAGLVDAVNVALLLGQPLLVTGEAGTGKTQLAYHLAYQLGLPEPLKFETKSNSTAKDLFYFYDHLRHFQAAQTKQGSLNNQNYITYNALGLAILRANPYDKIKHLVSNDFPQTEPTRSVVLIDEIDKAQRDFPNDILNEVEGMYFKIPELENVKVQADSSMRPLLVLTSNSEKHLPAAFLRRCVYYHIPFPDDKRLKTIIESRLGEFAGNTSFLETALKFFNQLRDSGLQKKPATAELLNWLQMLKAKYPEQENPFSQGKQVLESTLSVLVKSQEDREIAQQLIDGF